MINLLQETIDFIEGKKLNPLDVIWVGNKNKSFSWFEFESIAKDINYTPSTLFSTKITTSLIICGPFWWLTRDASELYEEHWVLNLIPYRALIEKPSIEDFKNSYTTKEL